MLKIFNHNLLKKVKKYNLIRRGSSFVTAMTLAMGLSGCSSVDSETQQQEEVSTSISQIQVDGTIGDETNFAEDKQTEFWLDEDCVVDAYWLKISNFDLMLTQRIKLSEQILNNVDCKDVIEEMKKSIAGRPLYFNTWGALDFHQTSASLCVLDDSGDFNNILYMNHNDYLSSDHLYISYKKSDNSIYQKAHVTYSFDFAKDGSTISKSILTEYNDYNDNKCEIDIENDVVSSQIITYNAHVAPFKIELYNKNDEKDYELVLATSCGRNYINLTDKDYTMLSSKMEEYILNGDLLGFVSDNGDTLSQYLQSIKPNYYDDCYSHAEYLIDSYAEKGKEKVLVP
ncbi:MAG: hypothetical protein J6B89_04130 [Bacilli bacterium]|nr:hypothetical protein [Bacilli bacterium]